MLEQLSLFSPLEKKTHNSLWHLYIDGAARNNPGPAGVGIYILKDGAEFTKKGFFLGVKTNNQAEYLALILGLLYIDTAVQANDHVTITSDSELLVKQIKGIYKVKNSELISLHSGALALLRSMQYTINHVLREQNKIADQLANKGIDQKIPLPDDIQTALAKILL